MSKLRYNIGYSALQHSSVNTLSGQEKVLFTICDPSTKVTKVTKTRKLN